MNGPVNGSFLRRAAERFGTPLYLYDFGVIERRVRDLRRAVGPRFEIAYAVKANPSLAVLSFLRTGLGGGVVLPDSCCCDPGVPERSDAAPAFLPAVRRHPDLRTGPGRLPAGPDLPH